MIAKRGAVYVLHSKDGSKVLGRHRTRADAERQEAAINIAKARAAGHKIPRRK